jgi:hypothetical protein
MKQANVRQCPRKLTRSPNSARTTCKRTKPSSASTTTHGKCSFKLSTSRSHSSLIASKKKTSRRVAGMREFRVRYLRRSSLSHAIASLLRFPSQDFDANSFWWVEVVFSGRSWMIILSSYFFDTPTIFLPILLRLWRITCGRRVRDRKSSNICPHLACSPPGLHTCLSVSGVP